MNVNANELAQLFQMTVQYLEQSGIRKITFRGKNAYYPKIWCEDVNFSDPSFVKCPPCTIGSLDDDIEDVKYVLTDKFGFCSLHMEKLGAILIAVGFLLNEGVDIQPDDGEKYSELFMHELKRLFKIMLWFMQWKKINEISFEKNSDYYLKIPHEKVDFYDDNFLKCPPCILCSSSQDILDLKKVLTGEVKMDAVSLQKVGALLTAIGETI